MDVTRMFNDEAYKHLRVINQSLLDLESDPTNADVLCEIFCNIHALKSMSATMDLGKIVELTYEMENLSDKLRRGEAKATTEIIDTLFSSFDVLQVLVGEVTSGRSKSIDIAPVLKSLRELSYTPGWPSDELISADKESAALYSIV
jgi:two-component system chemotaxis sensor kinase CheA